MSEVAVSEAVEPRETFIRAAEVWVPDSARTHLILADGLYGEVAAFGATSRNLLFSRGEGLPGAVWETGKPIILGSLEGSTFRRTAAARAAGLSSAVGIPVFAGDFMTGVLLLFCGDDEHHAGAIELWQAGGGGSSDMALVDGYYGATGEAFEFASRRTTFRPGIGLPGIAWQTNAPVFMEDLGRSSQFVRADSARLVGINRGLAFPCSVFGSDKCVLTFLSALGTPMFRRVEVWVPDANRTTLGRADGFCEATGRLGADPRAVVEYGHGALGHLWVTGVPAISAHARAEMAFCEAELEAAGISTFVALPIVADGKLRSVVVWYF